MSNLYRMNFEASDAVLLFILPKALVDEVIKFIIHRLHITTTGDGIAFSFPLSHMKGISLDQKHIFEDEIEELKEHPPVSENPLTDDLKESLADEALHPDQQK